MSVYICLWLSVFLLSFFIRQSNKKIINKEKLNLTICIQKIPDSLIFVLLFLVSALRYGIGTDYFYAYYPTFFRITSGMKVSDNEPLFYLLNLTIGKFTNNPQWLFAISSFLFALLICAYIYDESKNYIYSFFLLFTTEAYFVSLNNIRQCLAFAISVYALRYLKQEKYITYALFIVAAALMHNSSIIYLAFIPVHMFSNRAMKVMPIVVAASIIFKGILSTSVISFIISHTILKEYLIYSLYLNNTIPKFTLLFNAALWLVMFILPYWKKDLLKDKSYALYYTIQTLAIIICIFDGIIPAAYRVLRILTFYHITLIPNCFSELGNKYLSNGLKFIFILFSFAICYIEIFSWGNEGIIPYVSIFS